ncbi:MAG: hypothetical protein JWQ14_2443 [Adhaeribacter sp.]|nr:hypothetical protein [Adhaeribacter sp.]
MKKVHLTLIFLSILSLSACSNQNTGIHNESGSAGNAAANDSSTTNPINSEYGTPNASENAVDSAQSAKPK